MGVPVAEHLAELIKRIEGSAGAWHAVFQIAVFQIAVFQIAVFQIAVFAPQRVQEVDACLRPGSDA